MTLVGFFVDKIEKQWYSQNKFLKLWMNVALI
jgi:hypothetical protein